MSIQLKKSEYSIMDAEDERQIVSADVDIKKALVYDLKGKKQITFIGLKWLTLKMSQAGQALEVIESTINLDKDEDKKEFWFWRAKVKVRNQKTGLETEGIAECPYLEKIWVYENNKKTDKFNLVYDSFGKTKAHSKAERNAWRKQIPEVEITNMLKTVESERVDELEPEPKIIYCSCEIADAKPNKLKTACVTCKGSFNTYQRKSLGLDD